jgi:2-hydroxy-3-oxopropionate reductase
MAELGFIGLGAMGGPMARRLLDAGHRVAVFARRAEAMEPLVRCGAGACASPMEVAARSDVVFTMVTDTGAVEDVALGDRGVVHGSRAGAILIDHSTISPSGSRRIAAALAAKGVAMLDAPVSGGVTGAEAGTLSIMAGGDETVFERCRNLLSCLGQTIVYMGPAGAGQIAKACNQICIVVNQMGVAEALLLAERSGLDPLRLKDALMGGFAASHILEVQGPKMAARDFDGRIESRLHHKDIRLALESASELGLSLRASALAADFLTLLEERGGARSDSAAVFEVVAERSGSREV